MVIFVENPITQCYWIGCIQDEFMNPWFLDPQQGPGGIYPRRFIQRFKKKVKGYLQQNITKNKQTYIKEIIDRFLRFTIQFSCVLSTQGLLQDHKRADNVSRPTRYINTVYGWNTPGPLDKRNGAPKGKYGEKGQRN